jgi:putative SOS response-associated peptidase YedK
LINARSETMAEKRIFRDAVPSRRRLVPVLVWIEFESVAGRRLKRLWRFHRPADGQFAMAGLWEGTPGAEDLRFTILTRAACPRTADIHDRMPVLLPPPARHVWLQGRLPDPASAAIRDGWLRRNEYVKAAPNDLLTGP